ncbi:non-hydrolyzing UDP-N-acetylglucosamine 2-epimerase [Agromyces sp. NPDC058126]|uniref:non-hydrolyzing UDP-N-acetylglucosamine 2-epimerase n=1 Tax=Agromyces sp. NPDC058126 TaxID=3346350 RepID=UPI0036D87834
MPRILVVYGTRPEAIKLAPVVTALRRTHCFETVVAVTAQHRLMLDQVNGIFGIRPDHDLDLLRERPNLTGITAGTIEGIEPLLAKYKPDMMLVQGDTTTVFAAALAAFYAQVPVAHLEAGLRTSHRYDPYPEEINRRLATVLASLHLAPTSNARRNLEHEGVDPASIHVTGNTVIDALLQVHGMHLPTTEPALDRIGDAERLILVTSHRRENWGAPMERIGRAVARLARRYPQARVLLPAHLNPIVRESLLPPLEGLDNVVVTAPLDYVDMAHAVAASTIVLTDSGGVQEEAPSLGKPVLVLRETTERPEAVEAGTVALVGTDEDRIVDTASELLDEPARYLEMARAVNPYGDGRASERVLGALGAYFGLNEPLEEFAGEAAGAASAEARPTSRRPRAHPVLSRLVVPLREAVQPARAAMRKPERETERSLNWGAR